MNYLVRTVGYFKKVLSYHEDPSLRQYWMLHKGLVISATVAVVCILYAWFEFSGATSQSQVGVLAVAHNNGKEVGAGLLGTSLIAIISALYFIVRIARSDQ